MTVDIVECRPEIRGLLTDLFEFRIFHHRGIVIEFIWDRREIKQIN